MEKNKSIFKIVTADQIYQAASYLDENHISDEDSDYLTIVDHKKYSTISLLKIACLNIDCCNPYKLFGVDYTIELAIVSLNKLGFSTYLVEEKQKKIDLYMLLNLSISEINNCRISLNIRPNVNDTWLSLWLIDKTCLNRLYYSPSNKNNYKIGQIVFSFLKMPEYDKWLLVDVSIITDKPDSNGFHPFSRVEKYAPLFGKLVIDLHRINLYNNYIFKLSTYIGKAFIHEIRSVEYGTIPFPGFEYLNISFNDLKRLIDLPDWKSSLMSVSGIYLISDEFNGKRYVGSSYGINGIFGRWKQYLDNGYDSSEEQTGVEFPNSQLKEIATDISRGMKYIERYFKFSILEVLPKGFSNNLVIKRESHWKDILNTRNKLYGYNSN